MAVLTCVSAFCAPAVVLTLVRAASRRRTWASRRVPTARPAASSEGLTILLPELRRASDLLNAAELASRLCAETCAVVLVLMIMATGFWWRAPGQARRFW